MNGPERGEPTRDANALGPSEPGARGQDSTFATPLGASSSGRLVFASGISGTNIHADTEARDLYRARFDTPVPNVLVEECTVTIRYPRLPIRDWLQYRYERSAKIALNARIPWDIEARGGVSRFTADLRGLMLCSLILDGGASRVELAVPRPSGTVRIRIMGGASNVAVRYPESAAVRVQVLGGVTNLTFDEHRLGAVGGEVDLRSPGYDDATDRYEIAITGGANNLLVSDTSSERQSFIGGH